MATRGGTEARAKPALAASRSRGVPSQLSVPRHAPRSEGRPLSSQREVRTGVRALDLGGERARELPSRALLASDQSRSLHRRGRGTRGARSGNEVAGCAARAYGEPSVRSKGAGPRGPVPPERPSEPAAGASDDCVRTPEREGARPAGRRRQGAARSGVFFPLVRRVEEGGEGKRCGAAQGSEQVRRVRKDVAAGHGMEEARPDRSGRGAWGRLNSPGDGMRGGQPPAESRQFPDGFIRDVGMEGRKDPLPPGGVGWLWKTGAPPSLLFCPKAGKG